jgi:hypothetical protein
VPLIDQPVRSGLPYPNHATARCSIWAKTRIFAAHRLRRLSHGPSSTNGLNHYAAKLEFSSKDLSSKPGAGHDFLNLDKRYILGFEFFADAG